MGNKGLLPLGLLLLFSTRTSLALDLYIYEVAHLPQVARTLLEATGCCGGAPCAFPAGRVAVLHTALESSNDWFPQSPQRSRVLKVGRVSQTRRDYGSIIASSLKCRPFFISSIKCLASVMWYLILWSFFWNQDAVKGRPIYLGFDGEGGGSQLETSVVCFTWKTWIRRSIVVNIGQLISVLFPFYKVYVIKKILWLPSFFFLSR